MYAHMLSNAFHVHGSVMRDTLCQKTCNATKEAFDNIDINVCTTVHCQHKRIGIIHHNADHLSLSLQSK